ncbi:MAG: hypothetical protein Kow0069_09380 [Promethearchaeota archaeon]
MARPLPAELAELRSLKRVHLRKCLGELPKPAKPDQERPPWRETPLSKANARWSVPEDPAEREAAFLLELAVDRRFPHYAPSCDHVFHASRPEHLLEIVRTNPFDLSKKGVRKIRLVQFPQKPNTDRRRRRYY